MSETQAYRKWLRSSIPRRVLSWDMLWVKLLKGAFRACWNEATTVERERWANFCDERVEMWRRHYGAPYSMKATEAEMIGRAIKEADNV